MLIQDGHTVLFIGDSITDCGRRDANAPYGYGYVDVFRDCMISRFPDRNIDIVNKGISGNRITELEYRWYDDVMRFQPDWLSIMVGINDMYSVMSKAEDPTTPEVYRKTYNDVLARTLDTWQPDILLLSPFFISEDFKGDNLRGRVLAVLPEYIQIVKELSEKYGTRYVDLHSVFQQHLKYRDAETFCPEPVHPNRRGHTVIARAVIDAFSA